MASITTSSLLLRQISVLKLNLVLRRSLPKVLTGRLQWPRHRGYRAFSARIRCNLASSRAFTLSSGTLSSVDYSDPCTDHCRDFWRDLRTEHSPTEGNHSARNGSNMESRHWENPSHEHTCNSFSAID